MKRFLASCILLAALAAGVLVLHAERIPDVRQPTLIIWGEDDIWIPVRFAHRFHADLPTSELRLYPGVGHVPQEEAPERSAGDARAFLLRSPASGSLEAVTEKDKETRG